MQAIMYFLSTSRTIVSPVLVISSQTSHEPHAGLQFPGHERRFLQSTHWLLRRHRSCHQWPMSTCGSRGVKKHFTKAGVQMQTSSRWPHVSTPLVPAYCIEEPALGDRAWYSLVGRLLLVLLRTRAQTWSHVKARHDVLSFAASRLRDERSVLAVLEAAFLSMRRLPPELPLSNHFQSRNLGATK